MPKYCKTMATNNTFKSVSLKSFLRSHLATGTMPTFGQAKGAASPSMLCVGAGGERTYINPPKPGSTALKCAFTMSDILANANDLEVAIGTIQKEDSPNYGAECYTLVSKSTLGETMNFEGLWD